MANLKNKILQALRSEMNMEETFDSLSISQENLLKNNSNPVFSNKDKNKILKQYTNLQNLGKSLYRYNALKENDYDAEGEKSDIETTVLKGGISYYKYVWHSSLGARIKDVWSWNRKGILQLHRFLFHSEHCDIRDCLYDTICRRIYSNLP